MKRAALTFWIFTAGIFLWTTSSFAQSEGFITKGQIKARKGQVVVLLEKNADLDAFENLLVKNSMRIQKISDRRGSTFALDEKSKIERPVSHLLLSISDADSPWEAAALVRQMPGVRAASPNYIRELFFTPNDPAFVDEQLNFRQIGAERVWNKTFGNGVLVAVLDTGYRYDLDDGAIDLMDGFDTWGEDSDVSDFVGHGTLVANVIAQATNNNFGAAGLAPNVKLLPVKIFPDSEGGAEDFDIIEGINYALDKGAMIMNMSFGGEEDTGTEEPTPLEIACNDAQAAGALLIAATGNESADRLSFPASYDSTFAVGSCNKHRLGRMPKRSEFSNYGDGLEIVAPGEDILQEAYGPGYGVGFFIASGTSVAAPHVSAAIALLVDLTGEQDSEAIIEALRQGATRDWEGWNNQLGYGELNLVGAAEIYYGPLPNGPPVAGIFYAADDDKVPRTITFDSIASEDPDGNIVDYQWVLPDGSTSDKTDVSFYFDEAGEYTVELTVTDMEGLTDSTTETVKLTAFSQRENDTGDGGCGCAVDGRKGPEDITWLLLGAIFLGYFLRMIRLRLSRNKPGA